MQDILDRLKQLTFGQVAWAIAKGQPPDSITIDRLRYLRQLDVPFPKKERKGSGNRNVYRFEELVECALGVYAIQQRFKPKDVARVLVGERAMLHKMAKDNFLAMPKSVLAENWVRSRGVIKPFINDEQFIRLHDKTSETPGKFDIVTMDELAANPDFSFGDLIERYLNGETRPLVPLKRVMLQAVAWALEAPATKPGPQ